jgi:nicotinamidase-related amidase
VPAWLRSITPSRADRLLELARGKDLPVIVTTIAFEADLRDGGLWLQKVPLLAELQLGSRWVEIDSRLERLPNKPVVLKKGTSAFFGTKPTAILISQQVDTVILCGVATSGCIRTTAVDLFQNGFPTLIPRECVGDRAQELHKANLFDIKVKYDDVISVEGGA